MACLRRNDRAMIRWICRVRPQDDVSSNCLLGKLGIKDIEDVLRASRMRWLGHVERSTGWIARVREHKILAQNAPGRPKLTWDEFVKRDRVLLGMERTDPEDRQAWRGRLRPRLGSQAAPSAED